MKKCKRKYNKPQMTQLGSIEEITTWSGGGCGEFLGGIHGQNWAFACKVNGPADFGS